MMPAERMAAGPKPCRARQKLSMISFWENPAIRVQTRCHVRPEVKTTKPPYLSDSWPKRRRELPAVRAKALEGQPVDAAGIFRLWETDGMRTLKPEMKNSYHNVR